MKASLIALASLTLLACQNESGGAQVSSPAPAPPAASSTSSQQTAVRDINIKVSGGEYQPATVTVKKGERIRLHFTRDEKPTCGDTLVIPSLNLKETVPVNETVSIDITPDQAGDLEFTCGMNMMKGKIVVQ